MNLRQRQAEAEAIARLGSPEEIALRYDEEVGCAFREAPGPKGRPTRYDRPKPPRPDRRSLTFDWSAKMNATISRAFDRLESTRADVLRLLEGHDRSTLNRPRADGAWSALQVLHHVVAGEEATLGYIRKKMQAGSAIPKAGLRSRLALLALQAAFASPFRFRAPAATATVPAEIDANELRARWEEGRKAWRALLAGFPEDLVGRQVFRHPFVGRMGLHDTLGFMQGHLDHHARQVERALAGR